MALGNATHEILAIVISLLYNVKLLIFFSLYKISFGHYAIGGQPVGLSMGSFPQDSPQEKPLLNNLGTFC